MTVLHRPMSLHFVFIFILLAVAALSPRAPAAETQIKFSYKLAEISSVIEEYSKVSGQRFIVDPQIKGQITIYNPQKVSIDEAYAQLSTALALNGVGISQQGEVMAVMPARNLQRNFIDTGTSLPPPRPERMFTWIIELKHANADQVNKELRILTSRDGELVPMASTNQIIVSDWVSNLHRVQKIIELIDRPASKPN